MTIFLLLLVILKATAILLAALVAIRLARRARASVRHAILAATFAVLAVLPIATAVFPTRELPVLPRTGGPGFSQGVGDEATPEGRTRGVNEGATRGQRIGAGAEAQNDGGISFASAALGIWLTGAAFILLWLGIGLYRVQRLRRSALPCLDTQPLLPALANAAGVGKTVLVVVHEDITAPITCGIVRPAIVLPPDAHEWPASALTRALVHELEHVKRRDWAVQIIARAVCAIYWFHPLAWIAYRQLCLQAEHACDDAVVMREEDTIYADQLVSLARRMAARPAVAVLGMAERSDLSARVAAVLDASRARGRAGALRASAIAVTALALLVALAPLQLVEAAGGAQSVQGEAPRTVEGGNSVPAEASAQAAVPPNSDSGDVQRRNRSSRLDRALVEAADEGDLGDVRDLLDAGADVNAAVDGDGSPLIAAARGGHMEIVRLLLARGADVNLAVDGDGAPLVMAAREGHLAIVQLLLDRGADIDRMTASDENALIQASGSGQLETVKLLVSRGASVNARIWVERVFNQSRGEWRTPLTMALRGGHREVADFLRANGAVE